MFYPLNCCLEAPLLLAEVEPTLSGYDNAARSKLYGALEQRLEEMRGSEFVSASVSNVAPMSPYHWTSKRTI